MSSPDMEMNACPLTADLLMGLLHDVELRTDGDGCYLNFDITLAYSPDIAAVVEDILSSMVDSSSADSNPLRRQAFATREDPKFPPGFWMLESRKPKGREWMPGVWPASECAGPGTMGPWEWCYAHCSGWNGETPTFRTREERKAMYAKVAHMMECLRTDAGGTATSTTSGCRPRPR